MEQKQLDSHLIDLVFPIAGSEKVLTMLKDRGQTLIEFINSKDVEVTNSQRDAIVELTTAFRTENRETSVEVSGNCEVVLVDMKHVESSNINKIGYSRELKTMYVEFSSGVYAYSDTSLDEYNYVIAGPMLSVGKALTEFKKLNKKYKKNKVI